LAATAVSSIELKGGELHVDLLGAMALEYNQCYFFVELNIPGWQPLAVSSY
jgi:hypothetical protein